MKVVVAGHLCLDIIPAFRADAAALEPGRLIEVGAATIACGGGVANVGQALLRLGVETSLMGKVGDDAFGAMLQRALAPGAARGLIHAAGESTSYTVVISPPGMDRMFLHHPGCNDTFGPADVDLAAVAGADLFYLGYPPLLRRLYQDGGVAFAQLLETIKTLGLTTVLDLALPDPSSDAGKCDWRAFLVRVLPHTDFLMPSLQEVCFMLEAPAPTDTVSLGPLADVLLEMGASAVALKLGAGGLYMKTADLSGANLGRAVATDSKAWSERELWTPVFDASVKGTTGAGDATIAGFVAALLDGRSPAACIAFAAAVGATSVEALDAVSGVGSYDDVTARMHRGWGRIAHELDGSYWQAGAAGVYRGRHDRGGRTQP